MDAQQHRVFAAPIGLFYFIHFTCDIIVVIVFIFIAAMALESPPALRGSIFPVHRVPEGYVGVYWRGGALLKNITDPGFHLKLPLITQFQPIQVTIQTDLVRNIPCRTKGGAMIHFKEIEVVNRLHKDYVFETLQNYSVHYDKIWIYDKIRHKINQFCSSHSLQQVYIDVYEQIEEVLKDALQADCRHYAPGIEILSVHVTKPVITDSINQKFEQMEEERVKVLVAEEQQRMTETVAQTVQKMAEGEALKNARVSLIQMEQKLAEKDSVRKQEDIANAIHLAKEKSTADAEFYRMIREAEANERKLTPQYLELKFMEAIANKSKIFFGDKVPNMVFDQRLLGNFI